MPRSCPASKSFIYLRTQTVVLPLLLVACQLVRCTTPPIPARDMSEVLSSSTFTRQGDYVVSADDRVTVRVYGQDKLSGTYAVSTAGVLNFPLVGFVQAAGGTTLQLTERLQTALAPFVKNPIVTVTIASYDSFRVYLSGELAKPGVAQLQGRTTLLQALVLGGGLTARATGRIVLLRQTQTGVQRYATSYRKLLAGYEELDRIVLERGDVLHAE